MKYFSTPWNHTTTIKEVAFTIKAFPLRGYKILHVSDIHVGFLHLGRAYLDYLVEMLLLQEADICLITGDLISYRGKVFSEELFTPLERLAQKYPTYFVVGNHEMTMYHREIEFFFKQIQTLGITPLFNESTIINKGDASFNLVGIGDHAGIDYGLPPDIVKSFSEVDVSLATIVMLHRPSLVEGVKAYPSSLILSGHLHGGQITKLGIYLKSLRDKVKYFSGVYQLGDDSFLYVTNGVGYSRLPLRLFAPSEMALIVINP